MKVISAYPIIVNSRVVANNNYEGGFLNAYGKRRVRVYTKPRRVKDNPDESPSDVQARELIDGPSYFDGDKMNSYADGDKKSFKEIMTERKYNAWSLMLSGFIAITLYSWIYDCEK